MGKPPGNGPSAPGRPTPWTVSLSSSAATIPAGGSVTVVASVTPVGSTVLEAPIYLAVSEGTTVVASGVGWVRIPVTLSTFTRDTQDGDTNNPTIRGNVSAAFLNGAPATGITIAIDEWRAVAANGLVNRRTRSFAAGDFRRVTTTVGVDGKAAYAFPVNNLGANTPGYHKMIASAAGVVNAGSTIEHVYLTHPLE